MPQLLAPLLQVVEPTFWMSSQTSCDVLRAVTMLSSSSFASCLAIMSCCEVCVEAMASPNTPSRLTSPTVSTAIEITTSSSENPPSARFGVSESPPRLVTDVAIDSLPPRSRTVAIRESGPSRPTAVSLGSACDLPHVRYTPRLHPSCPRNSLCCHPALNRPGRCKSSVLQRWHAPCNPNQSLPAPIRNRREPSPGAPIAQERTHPSAIDRSLNSAPPEMSSTSALP